MGSYFRAIQQNTCSGLLNFAARHPDQTEQPRGKQLRGQRDRGHQERILLAATGDSSVSRNLSVIVDGISAGHDPSGTGRQESVEVDHMAATVKKRNWDTGRRRSLAYYLASVIDSPANTAHAIHGTEVGHGSVAIEKCAVIAIRRKGLPCHLALAVNAVRFAPPTAQRTEVRHRAITVEKGVGFATSCLSIPRHLTIGVDTGGNAGIAPRVPRLVIAPLL